MKSPELNKVEGRRIDDHFDCRKDEGSAKELVETVLFGDHRTLKEILKL